MIFDCAGFSPKQRHSFSHNFIKNTMMMDCRCFTVILSLCYLTGFAQTDDSMMIRKIADEILSKGKAYEDLRILCKTVGARLAGSPQMYKAEAWGQNACGMPELTKCGFSNARFPVGHVEARMKHIYTISQES